MINEMDCIFHVILETRLKIQPCVDPNISINSFFIDLKFNTGTFNLTHEYFIFIQLHYVLHYVQYIMSYLLLMSYLLIMITTIILMRNMSSELSMSFRIIYVPELDNCLT